MNIDPNAIAVFFDFSKPTWDLFVVLFFIIGAFLYGFSLGRDRIIVILVSVYMSLAVVNSLPAFEGFNLVSFSGDYVLQITVFFILFLFLFLLFARSGLLRTIAVGDQSGKWYHIVIFSILQVGLIISIALSFLPEEFLGNFSEYTQQVFVSDRGQFVWIVAPIIAMAMIRKPEATK